MTSDKGIIYNKNKSVNYQESNSNEPTEKYNEELFEQFKQFILFQKIIQKNNKNSKIMVIKLMSHFQNIKN